MSPKLVAHRLKIDEAFRKRLGSSRGVMTIKNDLGCVHFLNVREETGELHAALGTQAEVIVPLLQLTQKAEESVTDFESRSALFLLNAGVRLGIASPKMKRLELVSGLSLDRPTADGKGMELYVQVLCHSEPK